MKIVFIEPASTEANVYSMLRMPLLGPVYLGTILKNRGHEVEIYHEDNFRPDYSRLEADVVGISLLTSTARRGYEIAQHFDKDKVILGGVHPSLVPGEGLEYARQVVVGEAEDLIVDIVEGRRSEQVVQGKPVERLDSLPFPDFSLIKGYRSHGSILPISTSRGCPFDCSFCSVTKMFGRKYRFRSPENVQQELETRDNRQFFFCDDNFTAYPARSRKLLHMLQKMKIGSWVCQVRCDVAKDDEMLGLMSRAGCKLVCIGFESVNQKTLQAYEKKQSIGDIVNAITSFHKRHIKVHGMFVLGGDDDNKKTVWDTVAFALKHRIDTIQLSILTPFPGTKVHSDLEKENRIFSRNWKLYDGQHIVFRPKLLTAEELQATVVKAYDKFYSLINVFSLVVRLRMRNAMFRFIGRSIIREWKWRNRGMSWLPLVQERTP